MTSPSKDPERRVLDALGYAFRERGLFVGALTHRSFLNEISLPDGSPPVGDNERLEFLGDAVLDLVVSAALFKRFPEAREGELSRMRAAMVHEGALAALGRAVDLGPALRLGRGEELSGGRERDALLADAFEAMIAAIYLDGGLEAATRTLVPLLDYSPGEALAARDPKTELQQQVQGALKLTPTYAEACEVEEGFRVEVLVNEQVLGSGVGRSKKLAQRAAAQVVLDRIEAEGLDTVLADCAG